MALPSQNIWLKNRGDRVSTQEERACQAGLDWGCCLQSFGTPAWLRVVQGEMNCMSVYARTHGGLLAPVRANGTCSMKTKDGKVYRVASKHFAT